MKTNFKQMIFDLPRTVKGLSVINITILDIVGLFVLFSIDIKGFSPSVYVSVWIMIMVSVAIFVNYVKGYTEWVFIKGLKNTKGLILAEYVNAKIHVRTNVTKKENLIGR